MELRKITLTPVDLGAIREVQVLERNNKELTITKEGQSKTVITYILSRGANDVIERQFEVGERILTNRNKDWLEKDAKNIGCSVLNHPLVQTKCILPHHTSEYGRVLNYQIAPDIWEILEPYFEK